MSAVTAPVPAQPQKPKKKPIKFSNLLLDAGLNLFEVTTLDQPLEVIKTTMASNRGDGFATALGRIWSNGGVLGFYQGLIPWAYIEASTKGAVLLFVASEAEYYARSVGDSEFGSGVIGGVVVGVSQAYTTMGFCTCMKTVKIIKHEMAASGQKAPSICVSFIEIFRSEGIRGINKGLHAVAGIHKATNKDNGEKLSALEKVAASALGGDLSAWNQPIEVIRVEMQSKNEDPNRHKKMTLGNPFKYIYQTNGLKGLYRGVTPRIGLSVWQRVCMVAMGDI
ncbi:citrate/oxoglutarate carrier protein [Colletotrichum liriopes]|uniref:Citrate/oxoglutarate carrier protein n=1 Tax=Colletotrichum liriopes TaxID=708192 RepID=A0AA37GZY2_9PEZI|nr:citrate/oxoglutarate carrier protein [Colletotrichum liriopes]